MGIGVLSAPYNVGPGRCAMDSETEAADIVTDWNWPLWSRDPEPGRDDGDHRPPA